MEQSATIEINHLKFYKERAIWVGTFLGGPLAAGYLLSQNFKALNELEKAKKTWIITVVGTIVIFSGLLLIPEDANFPNQFVPFLYCLAAYYSFQKLQGVAIQTRVNCGAGYYSWWRVVAVSLVSALALLSVLFLFVLLLPVD